MWGRRGARTQSCCLSRFLGAGGERGDMDAGDDGARVDDDTPQKKSKLP